MVYSVVTKINHGFKAIVGLPVTPDSSREKPENRTKHQDASRQSEFADHFQIVAVGVVHQKGKKSALHGSIRHGKSSQPRPKQRALLNQCKCVAPDGYPILPSLAVFMSKGLK